MGSSYFEIQNNENDENQLYRALQYCKTPWEAHVLRFKTMKTIKIRYMELYSTIKLYGKLEFQDLKQ